MNHTPTKICKYLCGKTLFWNDKLEGSLKWVEIDTNQVHDYKRCGELLKEQGKQLIKERQNKAFFDNPFKTKHTNPKKRKSIKK